MNDIFGVGNTTNDLDKLAKVQMFAKLAHKESYDGIFPYMYHLRRVAKTIDNFDVIRHRGNFGVLFYAAYLHDVLEDTDVSEEIILGEFGNTVLGLVQELTFKEGSDDFYVEQVSKLSSKAKLIKIADILANITDEGRKSDHFIRKRLRALEVALPSSSSRTEK